MCKGVCFVVPPYMLEAIALNHSQEDVRRAAVNSVRLSGRIRGNREITSLTADMHSHNLLAAPAVENRIVCTAGGSEMLPGQQEMQEGNAPIGDASADRAYDGAGWTWQLYEKIFNRNSVDGNGLRLISTVHYGQQYDNAFWNGQQMVYGDGDGRVFNDFTSSVDVIGHELTHGVTQFTAGLNYQGDSGALNESMSDCFGSMVKQYSLNQMVDEADWLIGEGLLAPGINGVALRSMKAPGTAYNDPMLGKDPQPDHMSKYVHTSQDNGGVHLNSGIPNKAFYLACIGLGGHSWEKAGAIWYNALTTKFKPTTGFQDAANLTVQAALELYGAVEAGIVAKAWGQVGIMVTAPPVPVPTPTPTPTPTPSPTPPGSLQEQIDKIFEYWENVFVNDAIVVALLNTIQYLVDQWFQSQNTTLTAAMSVSALQTVVDSIFAALIAAQSGHPAKIMALKMVKLLFDEYFKTHPNVP